MFVLAPEDKLLPWICRFLLDFIVKSPSVSIWLPFEREVFFVWLTSFFVYKPCSNEDFLESFFTNEIVWVSKILISCFASKLIEPCFLFFSSIFVDRELPLIFIASSALILIFDPLMLLPLDFASIAISFS